jgi:hypothetical protein
MLGESVTLFLPSGGTTDAYGNVSKAWQPVSVENCLVKPKTGEDLDDGQRPDGVTVEVTVALPKDFTAGYASFDQWRGARVALTSRGMDATDPEGALRVTGSPMRTVPCPTRWDTLLECGRVDG